MKKNFESVAEAGICKNESVNATSAVSKNLMGGTPDGVEDIKFEVRVYGDKGETIITSLRELRENAEICKRIIKQASKGNAISINGDNKLYVKKYDDEARGECWEIEVKDGKSYKSGNKVINAYVYRNCFMCAVEEVIETIVSDKGEKDVFYDVAIKECEKVIDEYIEDCEADVQFEMRDIDGIEILSKYMSTRQETTEDRVFSEVENVLGRKLKECEECYISGTLLDIICSKTDVLVFRFEDEEASENEDFEGTGLDDTLAKYKEKVEDYVSHTDREVVLQMGIKDILCDVFNYDENQIISTLGLDEEIMLHWVKCVFNN